MKILAELLRVYVFPIDAKGRMIMMAPCGVLGGLLGAVAFAITGNPPFAFFGMVGFFCAYDSVVRRD